MATAKEDEVERQAENCLAKAAYCRWVASITADKQYKQLLAELARSWEEEAKATRTR
jgi:hypothetical protein